MPPDPRTEAAPEPGRSPGLATPRPAKSASRTCATTLPSESHARFLLTVRFPQYSASCPLLIGARTICRKEKGPPLCSKNIIPPRRAIRGQQLSWTYASFPDTRVRINKQRFDRRLSLLPFSSEMCCTNSCCEHAMSATMLVESPTVPDV